MLFPCVFFFCLFCSLWFQKSGSFHFEGLKKYSQKGGGKALYKWRSCNLLDFYPFFGQFSRLTVRLAYNSGGNICTVSGSRSSGHRANSYEKGWKGTSLAAAAGSTLWKRLRSALSAAIGGSPVFPRAVWTTIDPESS